MRRRRLAVLALLTAACLLPTPAVDAAPANSNYQSEIDRLSQQISNLDEDYNDARIKLSKTDRQIRDLGVAKEDADRQLGILRKKASARAAAAYRTGMPDILLVLFGSDSITDFNKRMGVASRVGDWESGVMTDLEIANNRSELQAQNLRKELTRARALSNSIAQKRAALKTRIDQQKRLLDQQRAREGASRRGSADSLARSRENNLPAPALPSSGNVRNVLSAAYSQIGKPYAWGAGGPGSFDCSGFTSYAWRAAGVSLPHSSRAQYAATKRVARSDLQPGDLLFFGSPIHHVGIYVGGNRMIDSSTYGHPVGIRSLDRRGYVGAGRPGV
ncbi:MAG: NlpC/P60 family protein [Actinomycetota bacterium]